ncbi:hypothetical protein [Streptomyces sp. NPDC055036]
MTADLPEPLLAHLASRDQQRADRVTEFLAGLTAYERGLVHDAAIMGYAQGLMRDHSKGVPKDSQTIALVLEACFAFADLYPTVNAEMEERRHTVEYPIQTRHDDTWEQSSSTTTDPGFAAEQPAARRRMHSEFEHRVVRLTTTVTIEAATGPEKPDHA